MADSQVEVAVARLEQRVVDLTETVRIGREDERQQFSQVHKKLDAMSQNDVARGEEMSRLKAVVSAHGRVFWGVITVVLGALVYAIMNGGL